MATIRRLVIDVLKPYEPPMVEFTESVSDLDSVEGVTASLIELDKEVQNVKLSIEGSSLSPDEVESTVESLGGTVHSIDEVACGDYVVEDRRTPQD